jgi:hypothetical protein
MKKPNVKKTAKKRTSHRVSKSKKPKSSSLTKYENDQLRKIEEWKNKEPSVVDKTFGFAIEPLAWMVRKVVPDSALMGALKMAKQLSTKTIDPGFPK